MLSVSASVTMGADNTAAVLAKIRGLSDENMAVFALDVKTEAQSNVAGMAFENSTGELGNKIDFSRIGPMHYQIATSSGHASWIEFGTQFIEGKMPFLWPAYRSVKKRFFRMSKWI